VEREQVTHVGRTGDGFAVELASGERIDARSVVVASGHLRYAWTPPEFAVGDLVARGLLTHTSRHPDLSVFAGRTVVVVGAGQSALESAALLHEAGATVHMLVRKPKVLWAGPPEPEPRPLRHRMLKPASPMGPGWSHAMSHRGAAAFRHLPSRTRLALVRMILGPAGAWWLRDRVDGVIDVRTSFVIRSLSTAGERVVIEATAPGGPTKLTVDHVLAATGYHVDVDRLEFLDPAIRAGIARTGAFPALDAGFQTTVPGIYFSGLASAATFGPLMRFVCGTEFASSRLAAAVVTRG
jgi:thioredoxin reductase